MKHRKSRIIISIFLSLFLLTACSDVDEDSSDTDSSDQQSSNSSSSSDSGSTSTSASSDENSDDNSSSSANTSSDDTSANFSYSDSNYLFEVSSSVTTVNISGDIGGKSVYLLKTNPTSSSISSSSTRYVSSVTNITTSSGTISSGNSSSSGGFTPPTGTGGGPGPGKPGRCETLDLNLDLPEIADSGARSASSSLSTVEAITAEVDSTTKDIYVDTSLSSYTFESQEATLRAAGTYCYVWVVNKYYDGYSGSDATDSTMQISSTMAQKIAAQFDKIYPMVREVYGQESDKLLGNGSWSNQVSMNGYSDTGTMVNIVIYDINADSSGGSTVGYFYARDYFLGVSSSVYAYSNAGKYFYIDAYFANQYTDMVYSTLAHEFQHMVNWGTKYMNQGLSSGTWYNEMLSMICEDFIKSYFENNIDGFSNDDSPWVRLPMFNRHYYSTGLEYKTSGTYDVYYTYANNYAFGAWLIRNYGGTSLVNSISNNAYVDIKSITAATGESMETLLKEYAAACVINGGDSGFNREVTQTEYSSDGYYYPLEAINLWEFGTSGSDSYIEELYQKYQNNTSAYSQYYKFDGPGLFGYNSKVEIRPYGETLCIVGTISSSSTEATVVLNSSGFSSNQKVYLLVK